MRKRKTGALAVLLVFMMAFANIFGMMPAISVAAQEEKQQEVTVERASELVYGEQYLLVGGTAGKTSGSEDDLYAVVGATTHSGSKAGSVLDKVEVSGLDFSDAENQLTAQETNLWTAVEGENGTVALYNKASNKYMHFESGNRAVTLTDEATYYEAVLTDHHAAGKALAFRLGTWYLNFSESQNGFCAYDASTYSQNETKDTNQYALYEVKSGVTPTPTPDPDPSEGDAKATLLFCSDFQTGTEVSPYQSVSDVPESLTSVMTNISKAIYDDGVTKIDRVLAVGDYTAYTGRYNYDADATIGIQAFKNIIQNRWTDTDQFLFIQGNHDQANYPFDEGANEYEDYIVYCINTTYNSSEMGGFPWMQGSTGSEAQVKKAAQKLGDYLEGCITAGETRPIFIMVHLPLHFSGRTSSLYGNGDNLYSSYLFDVINTAAEDLDIVYLYGHNHSKGWDNYIGGSRVFKRPGDTILIPDLTKKSGSTTDSYTKEELNFTYMNAGYIGYFHDATAADELTATVCRIYDDKLVLSRYSEDAPSTSTGPSGGKRARSSRAHTSMTAASRSSSTLTLGISNVTYLPRGRLSPSRAISTLVTVTPPWRAVASRTPAGSGCVAPENSSSAISVVRIFHTLRSFLGQKPAFLPESMGKIKLFQTKIKKTLALVREIWYHRVRCYR